MMPKHHSCESSELSWQSLPSAGRLYVAIVIAIGAGLVVALFPLQYPHPITFAILLACSSSRGRGRSAFRCH
jgi:hypothetical protein